MIHTHGKGQSHSVQKLKWKQMGRRTQVTALLASVMRLIINDVSVNITLCLSHVLAAIII